jgi:putative transposase
LARLPRPVLAGELHLVVHRGQSGQAVFLSDEDRARYLDALRAAARESSVAIHAYALLTNEVRLLLTPAADAALAGLMQSVGRRYVRLFNRTHGRSGTPWEGRFRSTLVEASGYFLPCLRFVEGVAVAAPAAQEPAEAAWTSAAHHLGLRVDPLVQEHPAYWVLGNTPFEREAGYRRLIQQPLPAGELAEIAAAASKGWALGSGQFVDRIGDRTGRRVRPAARGRPRKTPDASSI